MPLYRAIALFLAVSAFFIAAMAADAVAAGKRFALVIGNSDYAGRLQLPNAVGDARAIAAAFESLGFEVTLKEDLKRSEFKRVLSSFSASAQAADEIVFYYAGHGFQYDGVNYLVPVDAKLKQRKSIPFENITLIDVVDQLNWSNGEVDGQKTVILLDACRNDPLPPNLREEGMPVGLAEMQVRPNTLIAFATQPGSLSNDGPPGTHSPFTGTLLKYIDTAGLSVARMMAIVGEEVSQATHNMQNPTFQSKIAGAFYLKTSSFVADSSGEDGAEDGIVIGSSQPKLDAAKTEPATTEKAKPKELKLASRVSDDDQLSQAGASEADAGVQAVLPSVKPKFEQEIDAAPVNLDQLNEEQATSGPSTSVTGSDAEASAIVASQESADDARPALTERLQDTIVAATEAPSLPELTQTDLPTVKPQFEQEIDTQPSAASEQIDKAATTATKLKTKTDAPVIIAMINEGSPVQAADEKTTQEYQPDRAATPGDPESAAPTFNSVDDQIALNATAQTQIMRSADIVEQVETSPAAPIEGALSTASPRDVDQPGLLTSGGAVLKPVNEFDMAMGDPQAATSLDKPQATEPDQSQADGMLKLRGAIFTELRRLGCSAEEDGGIPEPGLTRYFTTKSMAEQAPSQELLASLQDESDGLCAAEDDNTVADNATVDSDANAASNEPRSDKPQSARNSQKSGASKRSPPRNDNTIKSRPAPSKPAKSPVRTTPKSPPKSQPTRARPPKAAPQQPAPSKKKSPIIIW